MKLPLSKWDLRFLDLARTVAQWSKDLSSKVGAVAVSKHNSVLETGYNGIARGVEDRPERLERPAKYIWTAHAEENLVSHAHPFSGDTHTCCGPRGTSSHDRALQGRSVCHIGVTPGRRMGSSLR